MRVAEAEDLDFDARCAIINFPQRNISTVRSAPAASKGISLNQREDEEGLRDAQCEAIRAETTTVFCSKLHSLLNCSLPQDPRTRMPSQLAAQDADSVCQLRFIFISPHQSESRHCVTV